MKKITLIISFLALSLFVFAQAPRPFPAGLPTCLEDDFRELEKFYDSANGNSWFINSGWLINPDLSKWYGIKLTNDGCDVKEIKLTESIKNGVLVDFNLPKLEVLIIKGNYSGTFGYLTGTLPNFSKLTQLKVLKISIAKISGNIPNYNLPNLEYLELTDIYELTGPIPNFNQLPKLKNLNIINTKLKSIFPDLNNLGNLDSLKLFCNLTGNIPNFTNLSNLKYLNIGYSSLTGGITNLNLPNLEEINFINNYSLKGEIPNFTLLPKLKKIYLYDNNHEGAIPNFTHLNSLEELEINGFRNNIIGALPDFSNSQKLKSIKIENTGISGAIPDYKNPELKKITLIRNTNLSGAIPNFNLPNLTELNISSSKIDFMPNFSNCSQLKQITLSDNNITGTIPNFTGLNNLSYINLNKNKLYGNISTQIPPNLVYLGVVNNYFNFGNLEQSAVANLNQLYYSPQLTKLPFTYINNKLIASLAGSDLSKLTYKWFRNNTLLATTPNFNELVINKTGKYYYAVNHSILTKLTLLSDTIAIGAKLKGKVFFDVNNNCNLENTEKGRKEIFISFQSAQDTVTTVTDSLGNYEVALDTFNYQIVVKTGSLWKTCTLPNIKFSSWSDSMTLNIPMQIRIACPENHVNLSTQRLRRCFNNTYTIKYSNRGTIPSLNTYIIVDFDQWLHVLSATKPYTQLTGNQYRFDIGTLGVDEEGIINVTVKVDCDSTVIGQTHCSTAHIYPDSICAITSAWDKSSLQIKSKCELGKATFEVKNIGTSPTSQPRQSIVIEDQIMMLQSPINLGVGETKSYDFFPNGKTVRVQIEQANFHPSGNAFISSAIEGCGGTPTLGMITQFSQNDNENYLDTDCRQNIGAFDPNEKLATPRGYGEKSLIEPNTDIEYQINFQNEGTDTAFTVVLRDTIDQNLDLTTIQLVASSHPYSWTIEDRSTLKVTFNDIHLTTKKQSDSLSQGFLRYRISQKPNLASGIVIKNRAGIYFDFNKPIITNTTIHRIGRNFVLVAVPDVKASELAVKVFPNPFHNATTFSLDNADNQSFELKIMDNLGRVIYREQTNNGQIQFQNQLNQGIYYYQISQENKIASGKLMVF